MKTRSPEDYSPRRSLATQHSSFLKKRARLTIDFQLVLVNVILILADELLFIVAYLPSTSSDNRGFSAVDGSCHIIAV